MIAGTLWLILVNTGLFLLGLLVWKKMWVSRFGVQIPGYGDSFKSVSSIFSIMKGIIWDLESEYWIENTGIDGYIYLLFQRYLLKLLFLYTLIAVLASIPINFSNSNDVNFFTRTTLPKDMSVYTSWFQVLITYVFSLGVVLTISALRKRVSNLLEEKTLVRAIENEHEWLMLRTVQVRGLDISDRSGEALASHFNQFLSKREGKVVEVSLIPDFQKLIQLEIERESAILMKNLHESNFPRPPSRLSPRSGFNKEQYEIRLEEIEKEIQEATMKPYWNSGHAMVVFNSLASLEKVLYNYRQGVKRTMSLCLANLSEKLAHLGRNRAFSTTFERFEDDKLAAHRNLVVTRGLHPFDFIWQNVGGTRGFYFFRRLGLIILSILILLFLSTPAALLAAIKSAVGVEINWYSDLPESFANVAQAYLPSIFIVMLNQLLLFLIDISAYMERHYSHSEVQSSIFHKSLVYLTLNMLIIPGFTIAASKSFINVLSDKEFLLADILGELHVGEIGAFLVNVLLQKATFSSIFYLLRGPEIGMNYFSVWISHHVRNDLNRHDKWRRHESQVFQYGYFYALNLVCFGIVMTFCSTVPLVIPAGFWFFVLKHHVDAHNLLTVHGREIESQGSLARSACNYAILFVIFYQVSMIGFFSINLMTIQAFMVFLLLLGSVFFAISNAGELFDLSVSDNEYYATANNFSENGRHLWRKVYEHPLAVNHI